MSIIQRHIPQWDNKGAAKGALADELEKTSLRDVFMIALVSATAMKGIPGIERTKRDLYDCCCETLLEFYTPPELADLGPADREAIREAVWRDAHPLAPSPTFSEFVAMLRPDLPEGL